MTNLYSLLSSTVFLLLIFNKITAEESNQETGLSNQWVMKIADGHGDLDLANKIAKQHNFRVVRAVGSLKDYYVVELDKSHHRAKRSPEQLNNLIKESEQNIRSREQVEIFEREKLLVRRKRDYVERADQLALTLTELIRQRKRQLFTPNDGLRNINSKEDPFWSQMWYLNRHNSNKFLPDMNVTGAWALGYSGKGVSVTFLDDGLEWDHPDIRQNYDPKASTDINGNDDDPMPRYEETNENKHGTRCAGEVAAVANNSVCSVGVAYNSGIGGIRMLDGEVTDAVEAASLSFNRDHVAIYSASWGPDDNGEVVDGPGTLAKKAFVDGVSLGRNGLGSIFVWASGNGGRFNDSCACDGYANSIYTLSISSTSENSDKPWYLEECTSTLATTYSSGDERHGEQEIITTDIRHKCTTKHTGTSAAAPLAAGIIALALEANPTLTWRDVMYLTVLTSRSKAIKSNNYIMNKRGLLVSTRYGFGLMDAGSMVELAKTWKNVPPLQSCPTLNSNFKITSSAQSNSVEAILETDACQNTINEVNYIEQVEIIVTVRAPIRGQLEIYLTSPMGTKSLVLPRRSRDMSPDGFKRWVFMTVQLWGEFPKGAWKLSVSSPAGTMLNLDDFALIIHGTKTKPVDYDKFINRQSVNCNYECSPYGLQCGPTEYDCETCQHFSLEEGDPVKIKCVSYCPPGYYADNNDKKCIKCDSSCLECDGPTNVNCTKCVLNSVIKLDTNECLNDCPIQNGYFINSNYDCEKCSENCLTCQYDSTFCLSCIDSNDPSRPTLLKENKCIYKGEVECESGSYYDIEKQSCELCDVSCVECFSYSADSCLKCTSNRPLIRDGQCVSKCGNGYYLNETLNHCFKCDPNCVDCNKNKNECQKCKDGFELDNFNQCVEISITGKDCVDPNCFECAGKDKNLCKVCVNGFALYNGACTENPPEGFFKKFHATNKGVYYEIEKCVDPCLSCTDEFTCTKCSDDYRLINGECHPHCDSKSFVNSDGKCETCRSPCEKCFNESYCISCQPDRNLFEGRCIHVCPDGYFSKDSVCLPCHLSCETCRGPEATGCLTCNHGFKFNKNECVSQCPQGTYFDNNLDECALCNQNSCQECIKTPDTCTKCLSPLVLDSTTFTCKKCCSKSLHGKVKSMSCCNCPNVYNGFCLASNQTETKNIFDLIKIDKNSKPAVLVIFFVLLVISLILCVYSIILCKSSMKTSKNYRNVEYTPLNNSNS